MTRFTLLGAVLVTLGLASCSMGTNSTDQKVACYDTGSGVKCVPITSLPAGATPVCEDNDGDTNGASSESSADGPSPSDGDTSASSDSGEDGSDSGDSDGGDECEHVGDSGSDSSDGADGTSASSDGDSDGVPDTEDCDCTTQPPPDGGGGGGDTGGTPIPRVLRLQRPAMTSISR